MNKINFKGSVMLNPTPVVLVTSINKEGKTNVFTIGWVSTVLHKTSCDSGRNKTRKVII